MLKILFQGDSITDAGREDRAGGSSMGIGYPVMVAGELGVREPGKYKFTNLGVGGNKIVDLYARFNRDFVRREPDVVSILIGVNDVWHYTDNNEVETDRFEKIYRSLVQDLLEKLPNVKIMIMGCFVLDGYFTHENFELFKKEVPLRAAAAKKIAEEFGLPFIDLQARFDAAMERYPESSHWLKDGVHPAPAGHKLIADAWIETFETLGL